MSVLSERVGNLTIIYQQFLEASRAAPGSEFLRECRDLAWFQLKEAHDAYMGKSGSGAVL